MATLAEGIEPALQWVYDVSVDNYGHKPEHTDRGFANILFIFIQAMMDKMWDMQELDGMDIESREIMAESLGNELRKLVKTYTGIDSKNMDYES